MLFVHLYKTIFFAVYFPNIMIYILNVVSAIKNMTILSMKIIIKRVGFPKENSYYLIKRQKKRFTIICNQVN